MRISVKTSFAAFVLSSALVGAAAPAVADSYYPGIDPNNPPGTQKQGQMWLLPHPTRVDRTATGSIHNRRMLYPTGSYTGSYQERYQGGDGDYYRGIVPPIP